MSELPRWHYYEAHVNVEPVFDELLDQFRDICKKSLFRVAKLLMRKREGDSYTPHVTDSFCTGRDKRFDKLALRVVELVSLLRSEGFEARRYKIESTEVDSKFEDKFSLLSKKKGKSNG